MKKDKQKKNINRRKRWLCIAYAFPPINRSGTHRTLGFVRHLTDMGWDATVLSVDPGGEPVDPVLLSRVPPGTDVIRTSCPDIIAIAKNFTRPITSMWSYVCKRGVRPNDSAERSDPATQAVVDRVRTPQPGEDVAARGITAWVSRLMMTPDSRVGWIAPALRAGLAEINRRPPDVIFSTSPYMSAHLVAYLLSVITRIPFVADFRDPWRGNPFRNLGFATLNAWDALMERAVLGRAARIVCNTPTMTNELCYRLPDLSQKCTTILNGFDADVFDEVIPTRATSGDRFILTHCGQFYGPRSPIPLLQAVQRAVETSTELKRRLELQLIGPVTYKSKSLQQLVSELGINENVSVTGPMSHTATLSAMAGSDALVLIGATGRGSHLQVPNKLYEYLAVRKPIIAAVERGNPSADVLNQARAPHWICRPKDVEALAEAIVDSSAQTKNASCSDFGGVDRFERYHRAKELARVFESVTRPRTRKPERIIRTAQAPKHYVLVSTTRPGKDLVSAVADPLSTT